MHKAREEGGLSARRTKSPRETREPRTMTFRTSTHIAPIVDVSTYEGPFSYESLWGMDEESEREEGRFVCDDYDFAKVGERIVAEANKVFEANKPLKEYGVVFIRATKFGSPREYNFMTDWLDIDVGVDDSFWQLAKEAIFKPENRAKIVEYAGEHWVSYDGFSSAMLNRICTLSRDAWKHKNYGTHMATDKEVEDALLADLEDAFEGLATETSEDEFREFGAILALLWLIEYPSDFTYCDESPFYGSWVTDEMVESLQGNSSLSEFCTILEPGELDGKVKDAMIDFDGYLAETELSYRKYIESGVGEASQARAKAWLEAVRKDVEGRKETQRRRIEEYAPRWDRVREELDELREDWEAQLEVGWPGAWK